MRPHILTIIILVIVSTLVLPTVNAARINCILGNDDVFEQCQREHGRCYKDTSSGGQTLVCWIEGEDQPAPPVEPLEQAPQEQPQEQPQQERAPTPELPQGFEVSAEKINNREITMSLKTKENESAYFSLKLIEEIIEGTDDKILKPKLNINLNIKNIINIPPLIDIKLIPYILYILLVLSASALLLFLWIIKDVVEPKMRI